MSKSQTTPKFLKPLDGYPGAFIERLDELGPTARVTWVPDQRQTITLAGSFTVDQLRQMADMMEAAIAKQ